MPPQLYVTVALSTLPKGASLAAATVHSRAGLALGGVCCVAAAVVSALGAPLPLLAVWRQRVPTSIAPLHLYPPSAGDVSRRESRQNPRLLQCGHHLY